MPVASEPSFRKFVDPGLALAAEMGYDVSNFTLYLGGIQDYNAGIKRLVGEPVDSEPIAAMRAEHCARPDRATEFTTSNYNVLTTSQIEFTFVEDPTPVTLAALGLTEWPRERTLLDEAAAGDGASLGRMRTARPLADFEAERLRVSDRLHAVGAPAFSRAMLVGGRLYTGPLFVKYNAILRGVKEGAPAFFRKKLDELCGDNRYTTSIHVINAALVSLSQLTRATPVYRGVAGAKLPPSFDEPDEFGCKGGVELGFMST